ncbi:hypothetical protein NA57DRAFT_77366 [Rhizodiscina lignyota]|uniref:Major facilitator superfamily (MFS) profile domain-containing protein n=1 Tax=Rhizodiscina lignyota TaxID=1504668 RepID=A0A9P4IF74_9PEZI|nr:hypothetical protein NA57DRAFT_77366 [Rhizodiscina lignyota]
MDNSQRASNGAANGGYNELRARRGRNVIEERLRSNDRGIIDNPLNYRDEETELPQDVKRFFDDYGLQEVASEKLLLRGALLAQDEQRFKRGEYAPSQIESAALDREEDPKFSEQTKELKVILLTCCVAAVVQGWSQASITGANLQWPVEFGLRKSLCGPIDQIWIFGIVNAVTYFAASVLGAWVSDPFNEYFMGRRGALFVAALFTIGASIGSAFTVSWQTLFICRLFLGIGYGAKASVVPIFEGEVAPAQIRGRLLVSWQTFTAVGILLSSGFNLIFHAPGADKNDACNFADGWRKEVAWRLQVGSTIIPAIPLLFLAFVCSESPRWYAKKGNYCKAFRVLCRLRETPLQAARDLYLIYSQLRVETLVFSKISDVEAKLDDWSDDAEFQRQLRKSTYPRRLRQLFTVNINRRAGLAACIVMVAQQFSGINIFAFLATTLFNAGDKQDPSGGNQTSPHLIQNLWQSFGFALANALFSPLAYWFIDSKGRRFLLLTSLLLMIPLLLATGLSFLSSSNVPHEIFLILYTAAYSPGAGVIPFLYSSEVFPLPNREAGMSLACSVNFALGGVLALVVPQLVNSLGVTKLLGLFAGLDAIAAILVWLLVPGTDQIMSLENMSYIFGVPTTRHIQYQINTVFPHIFRRLVPCLSVKGDLPPLYIWNTRRRDAQELQQWQVQPRHETDTEWISGN